MASRTYLIEMNRKTYRLYKYLTRYRDKYYPAMTNDQQISLDLLIGACQAMLLLIPLPPSEPG